MKPWSMCDVTQYTEYYVAISNTNSAFLFGYSQIKDVRGLDRLMNTFAGEGATASNPLRAPAYQSCMIRS